MKTLTKESKNSLKNHISNLLVLDEKKEIQFLTENHKKNYEKAIENRKSLDTSKIDWDKEVERQNRNARND